MNGQEPKLNAQYYDDQLRQEMRRLSDLAKTKSTGAETPGQSMHFASLPTNFASGLTMVIDEDSMLLQHAIAAGCGLNSDWFRSLA